MTIWKKKIDKVIKKILPLHHNIKCIWKLKVNLLLYALIIVSYQTQSENLFFRSYLSYQKDIPP